MLLQLKLATKGFVSQHDDEEISYLKSPDLDELDDDDELDEEEDDEEENEKESSENESNESKEDFDDDAEIFNEKEEIDYSSDFSC